MIEDTTKMTSGCGTQLSPQELVNQISRIAADLCPAMEALRAAVPKLQAYLVKYQYGHPIIGRRSPQDMFSKFLPPCFPNLDACPTCKAITNATPNHRPLLILLTGAAEEYLSLSLTASDYTNVKRDLPYDISWPGDMPGLIEAVNALTIQDYGLRPRMVFEDPIRRLAAGARNVFLTVSLEDQRVVTRIKEVIDEKILEQFFPNAKKMHEGRLGRRFQSDHPTFVQMLSRQAKPSWTASLLVIPVEQILQALKKNGSGPLQQLLLTLLRKAWTKSRGLRSDHIRQAALYDAMQGTKRDLLIEIVSHHVLTIGGGNLPGFAPLRKSLEAGPFTEIQTFLREGNFHRAGIKNFPSILQPALLGTRAAGKAVYYSFQNPNSLAPIIERTGRDSLAKAVKSQLDRALQESPDLAPGVRFDFYQARGRPRVPSISCFQTSRQIAKEIKEDFQDEIDKARNCWGIKDESEFLPGGKKGFLSRFVRIALQGTG